MSNLTVGLYTRTSILTDKYDRFEKELLLFCKQQGWGNVKCYRDRVGGRIDQGGFDTLEQGLRQGRLDEGVLAGLFRQQVDDEEHNRDAFENLLNDARKGTVDAILVHDVGQLGVKRMEILRAVCAMLDTGRKLFILGIGEVQSNTDVFPTPTIDSPDDFGGSGARR